MIRHASVADAQQIAAIYNYYIKNTTITFEEIEVTAEEMGRRIENVDAAGLPWYVMEHDSQIIGYAYATKWRERSAYRFSVESTIYLKQGHTGKGFAQALYSELLDDLREKGVHVVIGGIALANVPSVSLHEKTGFQNVAQFREVGKKFDRWVDVGYWQLILQ